MAKTLANTYLFNKYNYNKKILEFIMNNDVIDPRSDEFSDVLFDIKRQNVGLSVVNVINSNNIKLMYGNERLPINFKVLAAKDIKGKDKTAVKVYIDCSDLLKENGGRYECRSVDVLISYLVNAMTTLIYTADERRIVSNADLTINGSAAYSTLFTHIVDYLFKISVNAELKAKCKYLAAMFYCVYVLGKDESPTVTATARKVSGITEREERIINVNCNVDSYKSLDQFIATINKVLKINLTLDAFVDRWMFIYGPSTVFGIEYFPIFSAMLTDAYCGGYINNQKTIEKIAGKEMIAFTKSMFTIGENALNGK